MSVPTAILIPFFALLVIFATLGVIRLVRAWNHHSDLEALEDPERLVLLDEKNRLLQTLRDLEHEHQLGKLSDQDYEGLRRHFEQEALKVLHRLDALPSRLPTPEAP